MDVTATWRGTRGLKSDVHMSRKDSGRGKTHWVTALSSSGHILRGWPKPGSLLRKTTMVIPAMSIKTTSKSIFPLV